jgi:ABC-type tungstate transport system permease subunit
MFIRTSRTKGIFVIKRLLNHRIFVFCLAAFVYVTPALCNTKSPGDKAHEQLLMATTTSTDAAGILDYLDSPADIFY